MLKNIFFNLLNNISYKHQKIPEWLPLDGLRIKIQHKGMQKLCNVCFGHHLRKDCNEEKVGWAEYVRKFRSENPDISDEFNGKWIKIIRESSNKMPEEKDYNLPTTKEECEQTFAIMMSCGIDRATEITMLKERKEKFDLAVKEYLSKKSQAN